MILNLDLHLHLHLLFITFKIFSGWTTPTFKHFNYSKSFPVH